MCHCRGRTPPWLLFTIVSRSSSNPPEEIPLHHFGPTVTPRMGFPFNAALKPAEDQTGGTSAFKSAPAPSTDHFHGQPVFWSFQCVQ
ncbi:hypothetical protein PFLUV_G00229880 [Perca fluviatilis]|uniref:Uncharacterized protein n=1 Tax=Perca fluviatilis TaxID=8168 RepID=A0A6A5EEN4_PERFL|nr:hypothetical protein PFLUV_G00229880 [Perca fluviatilis]